MTIPSRGLVLIPILAAIALAQDTPIDTQRSAITIHAGKSGLFSAAGHEHWINAPIASGTIRAGSSPHIEFTIETAAMTVKPDPKVDAKTQAAIQKDMEQMTLDVRNYPKITFESQRIEPSGDGWKVEGRLTIHGVSKTVNLTVRKDGSVYVSRTTLKQTDYGIKPISVGGGTVKVKDEVELDFRIVPQGS